MFLKVYYQNRPWYFTSIKINSDIKWADTITTAEFTALCLEYDLLGTQNTLLRLTQDHLEKKKNG